MLRKLLKYDFLAVWKNGWGILPVMAICTAVATAVANLMNSSTNYKLSVELLYIFVLMLCAFGIFGCGAVIGILLYIRFYKNFYTDEGYLTFTLPVKRSTLLISKTISAVLCLTIYLALTVICVATFVAMGGFDYEDIRELIDPLIQLYREYRVFATLWYSEILIICLLVIFLDVAMAQYALTLACSSVRRAKIILSIGVYSVCDAVVSIILPPLFMPYAITYVTSKGQFSTILGFLVFALVVLTLGLVFYFMTLGRLTRKLNID